MACVLRIVHLLLHLSRNRSPGASGGHQRHTTHSASLPLEAGQHHQWGVPERAGDHHGIAQR